MKTLRGEVQGACDCGYGDSRFCPKHGRAIGRITRVIAAFGSDAAEQVAQMFADPEVLDVCLGCWRDQTFAHASWCGEQGPGTVLP